MYGPRRAARPLRCASARLREPHLSRRDRRARAPATRSNAATTRSCAFAVDHGVAASATLLAEAMRPGRFDVEPPTRWECRRAGAWRAAARRVVDASERREVRPDQVLGAARPGRTVVLTGDTAPPASVVARPRGRPARPRGDLLRGRARAGAARRGHSTAAAGSPRRARGGRAAARAHARLEPLLRLRGSRGGAPGLSDTVVPRDFDVVEVPFLERGEPALVSAGRAREPRPTLPDAAEA